jgi:hypothetical protein
VEEANHVDLVRRGVLDAGKKEDSDGTGGSWQ